MTLVIENMKINHLPVLLNEVLKFLNPKPNENFIDCTLGGGGHAVEILKRTSPTGKLLGIDLDRHALEIAKLKIENEKLDTNRLITVCGNFKDLKKIALENNFLNVSGILFDLGLSSLEIADPRKGFSFQIDAPLDMRYGEEGITAAHIVNEWPEERLIKILRDYGEEKFARQIAKKICQTRKTKSIKTTFDLVDVVRKAVPPKARSKRIHFATKTFQALRIAVNDELNNLKIALPQAVELLRSPVKAGEQGGRLAVISFHSLEDRIVKQFFKRESTDCLCPKEFLTCQCGHKASLKIITRKPIIPTEEEIKINPRSRSAKLRVAEKL